MQIIWLGHAAFKILSKEVTVAIAPYDKIGLKMPKFQAEILLLNSQDDPAYCSAEAIKGEPFLIDGPGEYEVKDVFVYGVEARGKKEEKVTLFMLESEEVKVAHLGGLGVDTLSEEQLEILNGVDILLVPVGDKDTLDAKQAVKIISQIEPRIIIPMCYHVPGLSQKMDKVEDFLKEYGQTNPEKMDKFKIAKKDLPQEETRVIILNKD